MENRRQNARLEMDTVRTETGRVTPKQIEFLRQHNPSLCRTVLSMREQLGGSAKILAEQVYTSNNRFLYELIQNAEDNLYPDGVVPRLSFTLEPGRIVVDSNESGFTIPNIVAICKIAKSTKTGQKKYIGEKGIGFKSVFNVARKVHVQSEPYSFAFEHSPGDDGLGMLTPLDEEYLDVPDWVQTRMILYLREDCNLAECRRDFLDLPETLLLFLEKLKEISVYIGLPDYPEQHIEYCLKQSSDANNHNNRVCVEKKISEEPMSRHHFWIKRRLIDDMPLHEARKDNHRAEVVLAFPLDSDDIPICAEEGQYIYAFLPLRREPFKFLIQSDFITGANREDVTNCPWNVRLRQEAMKTFIRAVKDSDGFLAHPTLKYSWVRYVPTTNITHEFWGPLQKLLMKELSSRKLFFSYGSEAESRQYESGNLRIVTEEFRDEHSVPLLADLCNGSTAYVSEGYDPHLDLAVLRQLGTQNLATRPDFLDRLKADLKNEDESRWKSEQPERDAWHIGMCELLLEASNDPETKLEIQLLEIVPLEDADPPRWVRTYHASIYFPVSGEMTVPSGLLAGIVKSSWLQKRGRTTLAMELGVTECPPTSIFPLIEQRYKRGGSISLKFFWQDIKFLFWHHRELPTDGYSIYLGGSSGINIRHYVDTRHGGWHYCPESKHPYSMFNLLDGKIPKELEREMRIPEIEYFTSLKNCGLRNDMTGPDWLRNRTGIKITPQLRRRNSTNPTLFGDHIEMSAEFLYIIKHLPQCLLGVLESEWLQYHKSNDWDTIIRAVEVPILDSTEMRKLETTFLPLPKLKAIAKSLRLGESFGFLQELGGMTDVEVVKWRFLERFGVGTTDNASFWLALLQKAQSMNEVGKDSVFRIYSRLQTFVEEEDVILIRNAFQGDLIYAPENTASAAWTWMDLSICRWRGPEWFTYYQCLERVHEYQQLYGLLVTTLELRDTVLVDFLDGLTAIKDDETDLTINEQESTVELFYKELNHLAERESTEISKVKIRDRFDENELVYCPVTKSWQSPTSCIWAEDHIQLPGKRSIAAPYRDQATFFKDILGIKEPSLEMHVSALIQKASHHPNKQSVLQEMRNICALNPTPKVLWKNLSNCKCFPVRKPLGEVLWASCLDSFFIVDRADYGNLFRDRIAMLDFTLEEAHSVKPIFLGLKLESKFLSNSVVENTRVEDGVYNSALTNDLRRKAYAIARYAAHLGAPDALAAYSLLQTVEVFSSNSISNDMSIVGTGVTIQGETAYFHISQDGSQLKLYVPKRKGVQHICLARQLPAKLLKHLGVKHPNQAANLGSVITAPNLSAADDLLQQDGIIEVEDITKPEDESGDESGDDDSVATPNPSPNDASTDSVASPYRGSSPEYLSEREAPFEDLNLGDDRSLTPATSVSSASPAHPQRPVLYGELLDVVIQQARNIHGLPMNGTSLLAADIANSTFDHYLAVKSSITGEGHFLTGAAGELFVYEFLSNIPLPRFDYSCWKSTIRHRVAVHHTHATLMRWNGSETADIVYQDVQSTLTQLLIQQGYLQRSLWTGRNPTYYIEVKATLADIGIPFILSQRQLDIMEEKEIPANGYSNEIYLIARVFGMGSQRMGMHLYLDPAKLRREKKLNFVADRYIVTPC